jgi:hypothetical protein
MKKILLLVFMILSLKSLASHLSGGWIETQVINSTTIKVRLKLITDCSGVLLSNLFENVKIDNVPTPTGNVNYNFPLNFIDTNNIETYCNGVSTSCNGGTLLGFRLWIYEGIVNLPLPMNNLRIYYESCCRPPSIVNISNVSSASYVIYTDLFSLGTTQNNSPVKYSYDILANAGDTNVISYSFTDLEADSLNYQLSAPLESVLPIATPFNPGYSFNFPLGTSLYSDMDASTGNYKFVTPGLTAAYAVAFDLNEYRNGQILSKVHGEQVILVGQLPTNNVFNFGATGNVSKVFTPCQPDTIAYVANFNLNDSITIDIDSLSNYVGASLTVTNTSPTQKTALFIWQPSLSNISLKPDDVIFRVSKYACPFVKKLTYTSVYNVNACPIDSVWPGDINLDKTVNLIDGIYLAIAYNGTGSPRINASSAWVPQYAVNWNNNFNSGSNYKHADADGNGTVNLQDALVIAQNFNLSHSKNQSNTSSKITSSIYDPDVSFGNPSFTALNTIVNVPITLGDATNKVLGSNAVLFKIDANPLIVDGTTMQFLPSNGIMSVTDIVTTQYKDINSADLYVAVVKKNGGSFSGFGTMGQLSFKIKANATLGNSSLAISQTSLYGTNMYPQGVKAGPIKVFNVVSGLNRNSNNALISILPNPFKNDFIVKNETPVSAYEVMDLTGKTILKKTVNQSQFNVNTEALNSGIYFIKMIVGNKSITSKLIKE